MKPETKIINVVGAAIIRNGTVLCCSLGGAWQIPVSGAKPRHDRHSTPLTTRQRSKISDQPRAHPLTRRQTAAQLRQPADSIYDIDTTIRALQAETPLLCSRSRLQPIKTLTAAQCRLR